MPFKSLFGSRKSKDEKTHQPADFDQKKKAKPISKSLLAKWSKPQLTPGVYGAFPISFVVRFTTPRDSRSGQNLCLGVDYHGTFIPLNAVVFDVTNWRNVTLLSTPELDSVPLSYIGDEKLMSLAIVVALPSPATPEVETNHVQRISVIPGKSGKFRFTAMVGPKGAQEEEEFEWRSSYEEEGGKDEALPLFRRLVRLKTSSEGCDDVVFEYASELWWRDMYEGRTAGACTFKSAGLTGEVGPMFTLLAVTSILKIICIEWWQKVVGRLIVQGTKKVVLGVATTAAVGAKITMVGVNIPLTTGAL